LHPKGRLYNNPDLIPKKKLPLGYSTRPIGIYYPCEIENSRRHSHKNCASLGLLDFVFFDLMLLLALYPTLSITANMCVALGVIIVVLISHQIGALLVQRYRDGMGGPGTPIPVAAVSMYIVILEVIIGC